MIISGSGMSGIENNGSFVLWDGTISGEDMGIFSYDGSVSIRGGSVTASTGDGIQLSSSSVTVENGSVYGYFCGITNNDSDCTIKVTGGIVLLNTNTAVHVVAGLEICWLVTVKGEFGYMAKDQVSITQVATYSAPSGGGGGQEWSDPVL